MRIHLIITLFGAISLSYSQTNKSAKQILLENERTYDTVINIDGYKQPLSDKERFEELSNTLHENSNRTFQSKVEEKNKPYVLPRESELGPRDLNKVAQNRRKAQTYKLARNILLIVLAIALIWYLIKHFESKNR